MRKVWRTYYSAFQFAFRTWPMWCMIYLFNLAYCFLAVFPIRAWLKSAFRGSSNLTRLADSFDLNIFMDLLQENGSLVSFAFPLILIALVLYYLWISFFVGGVIDSYNKNQFSFSDFFASAVKHFFANLRLSLGVTLFYSIVCVLAFFYFAKDGLNVLEMENENRLVFRFQVLTTIIFTLAFFVGIFKEIVRVRIVKKNLTIFTSAVKHAFKNMLKPDYLILGFINLIFLVIVVVLHFIIVTSPLLNNQIILMIILSQTLLIFRMILKITRLGSFYKMSIEEDF